MANVARPVLRQTKLSFSPVAPPDEAAARNNNVSPRLALEDVHEQPSRQLELPPTRTSTANTRKRSATELSPDATDTRPPTKIAVTQPHGELVRFTNGVAASLVANADDILPSARSTSRPGGAAKLAAPGPTSTSQDKRSLRSHDGGSRLKSDLAVYFGNYNDIIAGLPKPSEFLDFDTPIYIVDEPTKSKLPTTTPNSARTSVSPARTRKARVTSPSHNVSNPTVPPAPSSTTYQTLDYSTIAKAVHCIDGQDPLGDAVYFAQHRRAERKEKQLRNIEKERAMHEKVQLERLLDGLQGPDWLKVMGITGVTDGEKKDWEAKRDYFVKEVEALVDKFRQWKEEEKRLRAEKEAALATKDEEEEDDDDDDDEDEDSEVSDTIVVKSRNPQPPRHHPAEPEPPKPRRPPRPHGFLLPFVPPEPAVPFESFYAKPHLRAAALGKHRHGRNASAFGQPIPDFDECEFELPEGFIDPQYLRDNARQRRRRKRESAANASGSTS